MGNNFNPSKYGLTLQKLICDYYDIEINGVAAKQFNSNFDASVALELTPLLAKIESVLDSKPIKLLTYTLDYTDDKQTTSPHNFLLANEKTLSLRTTKSGMIAPKTVGQAGFDTINRYFSEIFHCKVEDQRCLRENIYHHIHEMLPIFIECFFQSDYNLILQLSKNPEQPTKISLYKLSDIADYSFERKELTFTRSLVDWTESNTLKYYGVSIAEIQTHTNRTFKFRFKLKTIPEWFKIVKETNETLGMTAEAAICDVFGLDKPVSLVSRVSNAEKKKILPVVKEAFQRMPRAVRHTGSEKGERGEASKCSYDFELEGGKKLSLKTNTGNKVCPPEVGQPGADTFLLYFKEFLPKGTEKVTNELFKRMVFEKIDKLMPIYLSHLFDSDWLLWIYKEKDNFKYESIHQDEIKNDFIWEKEKFSFTKNTVEEWNESNTVKYDGVTIGEFQVHNHRVCFKFRFHMLNTLKLLRRK